ncbi:MAG: hypothetical protein AAB403_09975, partial [Planctomycetota bacterium]
PAGDLLPGADTRRFAVQGFIDASSPGGPGVTIAPLDAFMLRLDLDPLMFEALGKAASIYKLYNFFCLG